MTGIIVIPIIRHFPDTDRDFLIRQFDAAGAGEISANEFLFTLGFLDSEKLWQEYLENYLTLDPKAVDSLSFLVEKLDLYLLSGSFKGKTISGDAGLKKPSPDIYRNFLRTYNPEAVNCCFIDNSVRNLDTAEAIGFKPILFNRDGEIYSGCTVNIFSELVALLTIRE